MLIGGARGRDVGGGLPLLRGAGAARQGERAARQCDNGEYCCDDEGARVLGARDLEGLPLPSGRLLHWRSFESSRHCLYVGRDRMKGWRKWSHRSQVF